MNQHHVNLAIQVLPLGIPKDAAYGIVDKAIEIINSSKLHYEVTPFETVVEGSYEDVMKLLQDIQTACEGAGATELIINMKLQRSFVKDVAIEDKMEKYRDRN